MRSRVRRGVLVLTGAALAGAPLVLAGPAGASGRGTIIVDRGGPARSLAFTAARDGEAVISFAASAPGVSWGRAGAESAVVSIAVDGRHVTDLVVPSSEPAARSFGLGRVREGGHRVTLRFAEGSAPAAERVRLARTRVRMPAADAAVLRHAPIVVGRTGWPFGDPYQNATTDTPASMAAVCWSSVSVIRGARSRTWQGSWKSRASARTGGCAVTTPRALPGRTTAERGLACDCAALVKFRTRTRRYQDDRLVSGAHQDAP